MTTDPLPGREPRTCAMVVGGRGGRTYIVVGRTAGGVVERLKILRIHSESQGCALCVVGCTGWRAGVLGCCNFSQGFVGVTPPELHMWRRQRLHVRSAESSCHNGPPLARSLGSSPSQLNSSASPDKMAEARPINQVGREITRSPPAWGLVLVVSGIVSVVAPLAPSSASRGDWRT